MQGSIFQEKLEMAQRLSEAFPEQWTKLTQEQQVAAVDEFYRHVWPNRVAVRETLLEITTKSFSIGMMYIAAALAIVLGLFVNVMHDFLKGFGWWYWGIAILAVPFSVWMLNRIFKEMIIENYRNNNFLQELLQEKK